MDTLLHDLGGILLNALPTAFLVLILAIYLKYMLFAPMDKVLAERYRLTEGARKGADESLKAADGKVAEYETKLGEARVEIYREQEEFLRNLHHRQAEETKAAREAQSVRVAQVKAELAKETAEAKASLETQSEMLANQIADTILNRRVA